MVRELDKEFITRGVRRCSTPRFLLWLAPWVALLIFGVYSAGLCLVKGLNQTNMDNRYAFGLWIFVDLTIIALGAGAFFTGFLLYILKFKELKAVINSAVVIGVVCYSGAMAALMVDVGQPLRAWFTFWYPNVHSMLTEVTFCISCYLTVLLIEYLPILLKNRKLRDVPAFLVFEFELHKLIYVLAGVGTFLSFFHQGSLGGLYGVLRGRPFAFREGILVWPSTFFLFIISAAAVGPSFLICTTWLVEKITRQTPGERSRLRSARAHFRDLAFGLRACQNRRYADLDQSDVAVTGFHRFAILRLEALWHVDPVCRDCALRSCACTDPAYSPTAKAACVVDSGGGTGLLRRGAQPLRPNGADHGTAHAVFRQVPHLYAKLAGDRDFPRRGRLRRGGVLILFPLLPDFPGRTRTQN